MIAPAKRTHNVSEQGEGFGENVPARNPVTWQERYLAMLPRIRGQARKTFAALPRQLREEAIDEVAANTFVAYAALVRNGTEHCAYATALTRYAVAQYRSGRRVAESTNVRDVFSAKCQKRSGIQIHRGERDSTGSEPWDELLLDCRSFTPADAAALRVDFASWLAFLGKRDRRIAETLAGGESTNRTAKLFNISAGRVSQLRRALYECWRAFQGEPTPTKG